MAKGLGRVLLSVACASGFVFGTIWGLPDKKDVLSFNGNIYGTEVKSVYYETLFGINDRKTMEINVPNGNSISYSRNFSFHNSGRVYNAKFNGEKIDNKSPEGELINLSLRGLDLLYNAEIIDKNMNNESKEESSESIKYLEI